MNKKQEEHIDQIIKDFKKEAYSKYERGTREHSGSLWEVKGIIDMAIEECIDQYIYLKTLKKQLEGINTGTLDEDAM